MEFSPTLPGVSWALKRAQERGETIGKYLKDVTLALLKENPYILVLRFREHSRVLMHLEQEAQSVEMPLEDYIQLLLADRDRVLHGKKGRGGKTTELPNLWYAHGHQPGINAPSQKEERETPEDDFDLEAALENMDAFMAG